MNNIILAVQIFLTFLGLAHIINSTLEVICSTNNELKLKVSHFSLAFISPAIEEFFKMFAFSKGVLWMYLIIFNTYEFSLYYNTMKIIYGRKKSALLRSVTFVMHMVTGVLHATGHPLIAIVFHTTWNTGSLYGQKILRFFDTKVKEKKQQKIKKVAGPVADSALTNFMKGR